MFRFSLIAVLFWTTAAFAEPCDDYRRSIEQTFEAALKLAAEKAERNIRLGTLGAKYKMDAVMDRAGSVYSEEAERALEDREYHLEIVQRVCP